VKPHRVQLPAPSGANSIWLITFADISALMLAFFVMIFSMSTLELDKWEAVVSRLTKGDPTTVQLRPAPVSTTSMPTVEVPPALPLGYLAQILDEKLRQEVQSGRVNIHQLDGMVVLSLPTALLFNPGKADLTPQAREALFNISSALSQIGNQIDIQGHTAPPADSSSGADWKWRLSLERAVAVADEMKRIGYAGNPALLGLADSRFRYLDPGIAEEHRLELARRVDLVIYPMEGGS
jgi:chemotaxis protein MotB